MTEQIEIKNKRRLVTLRTIEALLPIEGADAIEVAQVGGWKVVVKKGDFAAGDLCIYFEIDSFLPDGNPVWQFLVDKSSRLMDGERGHRLRTIKLRGTLSQGFVMPVSAFPLVQFLMKPFEFRHDYDNIQELNLSLQVDVELENLQFELAYENYTLHDLDFSRLLGVKKYEVSLPAELQGVAAGLFPSFMRKTDQERCQNLKYEIFEYEDQVISANAEFNRPAFIKPARASINTDYEVSMKLDGSSMTAFVRAQQLDPSEVPLQKLGEVGVCSRNLQLKTDDANKDNSFVRTLFDTSLDSALLQYFNSTGREIAVQGELMGPGIQGNRDELKIATFFVFDIYDIATGKYMAPVERNEVFAFLKAIAPSIQHVPIIATSNLDKLGIHDIDGLLKFAEGPSIKHPVREGLVFKRLDGQFSFKAIANNFLLREK